MKIAKDGQTVFEGTLQKGRSSSWSANKKIDLWLGRAEALNITVNGYKIGSVGKGRLRNLVITRDGLRIGNKRLSK